MLTSTRGARNQRTTSTEENLRKQIQLFEKQMVANVMLNAVPDAFVVLNSHRQIVYANDALGHLIEESDKKCIYGLRFGEVLGCVHAKEHPDGCGVGFSCSQCGANRSVNVGLRNETNAQECSILLENGEALDLKVWSQPLTVEGEMFVVFAVQDISHAKRREIMERIFFHDILNTAGFIMSIMEMMSLYEERGLPADLNKYRQELDAASHRLVDEVKGHRLIVAAESGKLSIQERLIEVDVFITELVNSMRKNPAAANVNIITDRGTPVSIATDPVLLGRVLNNMLLNAVEASSAGSTVTVMHAVHNGNVIFSVNNQQTMPRCVELQVFHRSFTTKGTGRGLGTYSIKLLTENFLGGEVWFETNPKSGTTFFVALPLAHSRTSEQLTRFTF